MKKWLLVMLLAACTRSVTPTPSPAPSPQVAVATLTPPPATRALQAAPPASALPLPTPSEPTNLSITAPDGAQLAASFYPPVQAPGGAKSAPGVVLLHMLGRTRADWDAFARDLQKRGIAALALDLRGHGASAGPADWSKAPGDVRAAWDALIARPEVDGQHSAIIGASIGANLALIVGANNSNVATVVALSPGLDYHGVKPLAVMTNLGQRPVLLVASQDDTYAYDSVHQMAAQAAGIETYYFAKAGHGTAMFSDPSLAPLLFDWLEKSLGILKG